MQQNLFTEGEMTTSRPTITKPNVSRSTFYHGDCLIEMYKIADKSVDMILCDLPYGTTACKWDVIIPFEPLWKHYERVIKDNGAIVLTASQPFTSALVMSNPKLFRYEWIWDKKIPSGMGYARYQPMRQHEIILIFYKGTALYNPQKTKRITIIKSGGMTNKSAAGKKSDIDWKPLNKEYHEKNPITIIPFDKVRLNSLHPTQKPVALFEYLIKTYTNESQTVLDNCMGSGTTGVACRNTNRKFIGIEQDKKYFDIAVKRVSE